MCLVRSNKTVHVYRIQDDYCLMTVWYLMAKLYLKRLVDTFSITAVVLTSNCLNISHRHLGSVG